jgi:hypothetical protein
MSKPVLWKEPTRLTVEAPNVGKQSRANPAAAEAGIRADTVLSNPGSSASAARAMSPTIRPPKATASLPLLMLFGHHESCARLRRVGAIASCDCRIKPMEDPAVAVGLAVHFARISLAQRIALPDAIIELLARRVEEGDPACVMVAEWLETTGLVVLKPLSLSKKKKGAR